MSFLSRLFSKTRPRTTAAPSHGDPIGAFWEWWREASIRLAKAYDRGERLGDGLVQEISEHVHAIDEELAWETGPGTRSAHHFALSPEGDAQLRVLTQRWLARAPAASKSWEYYAARQPSGADPRLSLRIEEREFVYDDFRIAMDKDDVHAVIHVAVQHPLFYEMTEEERLQPTFLMLDNVLGEDGVTSWIGTIEAVSEEPESAASPAELAKWVRALRDEWDDEAVTLLEGHRDGAPFIGIFRLALKRLDYLLHDHHLEVVLAIREPHASGFHSEQEGDDLNDFEDGLIAELRHRAVWIGHETCNQERTIHFHSDSSAALQDDILKYCEAHSHWESKLRLTHDPSWQVLQR